LAEFAYNNSPHSSTTESPFFLNKGFHPTLDIKVSSTTKKNLGVTIGRISELHDHARQEIAKALDKNKRHSDPKRQEAPDYKIGDKVFLSTENIRTTRPTKKFAERRLGPFKIIQVVSPLAMKLELPPAYRTIHPVFHVSLLEPAPRDQIPGRHQPPPPPVVVQDELEWEVKAILDARIIRGKLHYLVAWAGYEDDPFEKDNWQPASNLEGSKELLEEYHSSHPDKPSKDPSSKPRSKDPSSSPRSRPSSNPRSRM
jgi:hypothetical protein